MRRRARRAQVNIAVCIAYVGAGGAVTIGSQQLATSPENAHELSVTPYTETRAIGVASPRSVLSRSLGPRENAWCIVTAALIHQEAEDLMDQAVGQLLEEIFSGDTLPGAHLAGYPREMLGRSRARLEADLAAFRDAYLATLNARA